MTIGGGRKDRSGKLIAKGSKTHKVTFRDEVADEHYESDGQNNEN